MRRCLVAPRVGGRLAPLHPSKPGTCAVSQRRFACVRARRTWSQRRPALAVRGHQPARPSRASRRQGNVGEPDHQSTRPGDGTPLDSLPPSQPRRPQRPRRVHRPSGPAPPRHLIAERPYARRPLTRPSLLWSSVASSPLGTLPGGVFRSSPRMPPQRQIRQLNYCGVALNDASKTDQNRIRFTRQLRRPMELPSSIVIVMGDIRNPLLTIHHRTSADHSNVGWIRELPGRHHFILQ